MRRPHTGAARKWESSKDNQLHKPKSLAEKGDLLNAIRSALLRLADNPDGTAAAIGYVGCATGIHYYTMGK
ncbi:hypothetical protein GCM10023172_02170 [Hymenobacter ginsengisoli]|uniref:Uncharacterized protein n=1 Tax=Hymenobacter ginsengisoli TaxID=1051626 RepID=A0ABP8PWR3_9BACT